GNAASHLLVRMRCDRIISASNCCLAILLFCILAGSIRAGYVCLHLRGRSPLVVRLLIKLFGSVLLSYKAQADILCLLRNALLKLGIRTSLQLGQPRLLLCDNLSRLLQLALVPELLLALNWPIAAARVIAV